MLFINQQSNDIKILFSIDFRPSNKASRLPVHNHLAVGLIAAVSVPRGWIAFSLFSAAVRGEIGASDSGRKNFKQVCVCEWKWEDDTVAITADVYIWVISDQKMTRLSDKHSYSEKENAF